MGAYEDAVRTLEVELGGVEQAFRDLTPEQWRTPTKLQPLDDAQPHWTLFELAGQVGRDRTSFIFPRSEVAPVVYDYAFKVVEGKTPEQMPDVLHETFAKTVQGARSMAPDTVGSGYYALMRLDDLLARKTVPGRPADLTDDLAWVRAASGRGQHPDPRLPLIG
jgi:hypothetical protein